jgi:chromosome segregation ATPase
VENQLVGAGVATVLIAVVGALVKAYLEIRKSGHEQDKDKHGSTITEYRELTEQYAKAYNESRVEVHKLRNELQEASSRLSLCNAELARAVERIGALEELLKRHTDLKFREWKSSASGSDSAAFDVQQG